MNSPDASALVLVGPMGAGKTSIGRRVARTLGVPFTDTDAMIVAEYGPIPDLFTTQGEERFRAIERDAVARALAKGGVVSLGGGSVLSADTREALARHRVVFLTVAPHIVAARLAGSARPLLSGGDPVARWQRIFAERRPLYEEVADTIFDTSSGPLAQVVAAVVDWARDEQTSPVGVTADHSRGARA